MSCDGGNLSSVDTQNRIDEGGLPSAAVRSTADHGVAMRPKLKEEGSPMESYVGLDVHSKRSVFVIEAEDGRVVARGDIPIAPTGFRQLRRQHELRAETPVALETGTVAFYAARELARVGLRPVVIDAHEVRVKAHRPPQTSDRQRGLQAVRGVGPIVALTAVAVFSDVHSTAATRRPRAPRRVGAKETPLEPKGSGEAGRLLGQTG